MIEYFIRMILAIIIGGIIGLEREIRGRQAGVRTQMLICLGSSMCSVLCILLLKDKFTGDIFRLAAAVICGIGFIQTGTIIKRDNGTSSGLTTAAVSWVTAIIGIIVGFGYYSIAIASFIITMVVSFGLYFIDKRMLKHSYNIYCELKANKCVQDIIDDIKAINKKVKVTVVPAKANTCENIGLTIYINKEKDAEIIFDKLKNSENVTFAVRNTVE